MINARVNPNFSGGICGVGMKSYQVISGNSGLWLGVIWLSLTSGSLSNLHLLSSFNGLVGLDENANIFTNPVSTIDQFLIMKSFGSIKQNVRWFLFYYRKVGVVVYICYVHIEKSQKEGWKLSNCLFISLFWASVKYVSVPGDTIKWSFKMGSLSGTIIRSIVK